MEQELSSLPKLTPFYTKLEEGKAQYPQVGLK